MKTHTILAAMLALSPIAAAAQPIAESLSYRAYISGLPLGELKLKIAMDQNGYATKARFDIGGLLSLLLDTDAKASANGNLRGGRLIPTSFKYWLRDGKKQRNTKMFFDADGSPSFVDAKPAFDPRSYDLTLDQARGAVDPATAVALLSAPRAAPCDLDMRVFDGRKLHRITLRAATGGSEKRPRCVGRYERLAGFKKKYMTPERRSYSFVAELKQIGANRWRPKRVSAQTKFGSATAVLQ